MKQRKIFAILAMVLVLVLSVGVFAACNPKDNGGNGGGSTGDVKYVFVDGSKHSLDSVESGGATGGSIDVTMDYTLADKEDHSADTEYSKYSSVLGDFYKTYVAAKAQTDTDARYAAMAIAEAKLLQTGTFIPTRSNGGALAIGKVAPYTAPNTLWGNDSDRFHNVIVTDQIIKTADRDALKAKYAQLKGTGSYEAEAREYLINKGYTIKDTYNMPYSSDPQSWDIQGTNQSVDSEALVNLVDNLVEYDCEGRLMSALATDYKVSDDGLTYTFTIRKNVMWVDKDGRPRYEVTAQDWVDGLQRALDKDAVADGLITGVIKGATEYYNGEDTDFSHVGVKALDRYTLQYTLEEASSYFISRLTYNPYSPFCKAYADSVGEKYGTSPDYVLSCGPYVVSNFTAKNKIVFTANPLYWAQNSVNIKTLTWISYEDNGDTSATYNDLLSGVIDGAGLNTTTTALAKADHADEIYVSGTDATAFGFYVNVKRTAYETINGFGMASSKTDAEKNVTAAAMLNTNFRLAFMRALDREQYTAQTRGSEAALYAVGNLYTTGTFVSLSKDVTIDINGTATTFAKGTYYGAIVQAQLNADMGADAMKVWDPTADGGIGSSSGFDGWYNTTVANKYLDLAIADLKKQGIEISASNPIKIDYPYWSGYAGYVNQAQVVKQSIESAFGGKVVINLVASEKQAGWLYAGYFTSNGAENNYDIYDCSGWGPDYRDPSSFLGTMLPVGGAMIKLTGIY